MGEHGWVWVLLLCIGATIGRRTRSIWSTWPKTAAVIKLTSSITMPPMSSRLTPHSLANLARAAATATSESCFASRAFLHVMLSDISAKRVGPPKGAEATPV